MIGRLKKGGSEKIVGLGGGGGSENLYTSKLARGGPPEKIEPLATGAAKISSFEFQYLHPPLSY